MNYKENYICTFNGQKYYFVQELHDLYLDQANNEINWLNENSPLDYVIAPLAVMCMADDYLNPEVQYWTGDVVDFGVGCTHVLFNSKYIEACNTCRCNLAIFIKESC